MSFTPLDKPLLFRCSKPCLIRLDCHPFRKLILILEEKGHLSHIQEGQHFLYLPTHPRQAAAKSAMKQVLTTFFGGNLETAVATLLSEAETELSDEEATRLSEMITGSKAKPRNDAGEPASIEGE